MVVLKIDRANVKQINELVRELSLFLFVTQDSLRKLVSLRDRSGQTQMPDNLPTTRCIRPEANGVSFSIFFRSRHHVRPHSGLSQKGKFPSTSVVESVEYASENAEKHNPVE